jgi:hypothetical protein
MSNWLSGFLCFLGGAILWLIASFIIGVGRGLGGEEPPAILNTLLNIGFLVMVVGPVVFWIIIPIKNRFKKRKEK